MPLQGDVDLDLLKSALPELGEMKWTDLVSSLQEYPAAERLIDKDSITFKAGPFIQFNAQAATGNQAKMTGLFPTDVFNVVDGQLTGNVPWRHTVVTWAIERREIAMDRKPRMIVDLAKVRKAQAGVDLTELIESEYWSLPGGTADTSNVMGAPYWIVPNVTQGFNGLNPFGYAAGAGNINSSTYPNWANYTDSYQFVTRSDLLRKMRRAFVFCKWKSPKLAAIPQYDTGAKHFYGTTYKVIGLMEEALEQANDNLGKDLAPYDGDVHFRKIPVERVPKLEIYSGQGMAGTFSNATYASTGGYPVDPIFGIPGGVFHAVFLEGEHLRHSGPYANPPFHTTYLNFIDMSWNIICRDRRKCFVITA